MGTESSGNRGYRMKNVEYYGMGKRIDDLLFEKNLSASMVASQLGMNRITFRYIMETNDGKISIISRIAKYFGVSLDWLVNGGERR